MRTPKYFFLFFCISISQILSARENYFKREGYIFEDAFLLSYRANYCKYFSALLSAGYSDLAFEKGYHTYFDATPDMFATASGFCLEAECEWKIPARNKISPFSISGIYYSTFNSRMNLNGVMLALKFCPDRRVRYLKS